MGILEKLGLAGLVETQTASRLIIVSNRLPVTVEKKGPRFSYLESAGGLATGLEPIHKKMSSLWVGWPGLAEDKAREDKEKIEQRLQEEYSSIPIWLSDLDIEDYYHGFSNKTIWPLFHYFPTLALYDKTYWSAYQQVNRKFAQAIAKIAKPNDIIWIHDYHLCLLPAMIREATPEASIGFFLHIPFPEFEMFRLLPWRKEILNGLLGSNLVGFHTYEYTMYFLRSVHRLLGHESEMFQINLPTRCVRADTFPIGIDFQKYSKAAELPEVKSEIESFRQGLEGMKVVLSVDRLDYTKGIPQRLKAIELFLDRNPQWHEKVVNIIIAAPSRDKVKQYRRLKKEVDELVGRINGRFGNIGWSPVQYLYRTFPFCGMSALYALADVALVTPLRDGMNLVAKEYVAAKNDLDGVLVLSEMTGASGELGEAVMINPNDIDQMATAIAKALEMPGDEKAFRMEAMRRRVGRHDSARWGEEFIGKLISTRNNQLMKSAKIPNSSERAMILESFKSSSPRLILLDYDGTLVRFHKTPSDARPSAELTNLLASLAAMSNTKVVIISGRNGPTLDEWFSDTGVDLICEHGVAMKEEEEWKILEKVDDSWKGDVRQVLDLFCDRTPGAFVEEKEHSLVWHYRNAHPEFGAARANELRDTLKSLTSNLDLQAQKGHKVIDVRNSSVNKGRAMKNFTSERNWGFIMAAGDDWTDEDMFKSLPDGAFSFKVGLASTAAMFNLENPDDVVSLLKEIATLAEEIETA